MALGLSKHTKEEDRRQIAEIVEPSLSGVARAPQAPQAPRPRGGAGLKGPPGARQEEVVAVTPWPGTQTSCLRGAEYRRYATAITYAHWLEC